MHLRLGSLIRCLSSNRYTENIDGYDKLDAKRKRYGRVAR